MTCDKDDVRRLTINVTVLFVDQARILRNGSTHHITILGRVKFFEDIGARIVIIRLTVLILRIGTFRTVLIIDLAVYFSTYDGCHTGTRIDALCGRSHTIVLFVCLNSSRSTDERTGIVPYEQRNRIGTNEVAEGYRLICGIFPFPCQIMTQ